MEQFFKRTVSFQNEDLEQIPGAPSLIESVTQHDATSDLPAHLTILGWTAPQNRFALKLPHSDTWTGRFLFLGCGGPCGWLNVEGLNRGLAAGFATATADMGHQATGFTSLWAAGNPDAQIDWGWRGTNVTGIACKYITQHVYDRPIDRSYFTGSTTGGRQAMVQAQRFPDDYDGVMANSSGHDPIYMGMIWPWMAQLLFESDGTPILTQADMAVIVPEVLRQSDEADGLADGIISRPDLVDLEFGSLPLPSRKIEILQKLYAGPRDQTDNRDFRGVLAGSEAEGDWQTLWVDSSLLFTIARGLLRFTVYDDPPGPKFRVSDWKLNDWPTRSAKLISNAGAINPDLDRFRERGSKLIMTQPMGDGWVDPSHATRYIDSLATRYGSVDDVASFARLFMIPAKGHGTGFGTYGPTADALDQLVAWVEEGAPPEQMMIDYESRPTRPAQSRPVFPYPSRTEWTGEGSWTDPSRFAPSRP